MPKIDRTAAADRRILEHDFNPQVEVIEVASELGCSVLADPSRCQFGIIYEQRLQGVEVAGADAVITAIAFGSSALKMITTPTSSPPPLS